MSTPLERSEPRWLGRLSGAVRIEQEARAIADRLAEYRDDMLRDARAEGVPAIRLAELTGLSRPRVYQILNAPHPDDFSSMEDFASEMDTLWHEAEDRWENENYRGRIEDYFPLGEAIDVAR
jgi:hypothetical protein